MRASLRKPMLSTASSTRSGVRVANGWAMLTPARSRLPRPAKHGSADGASIVVGLEVSVVWADAIASRLAPTLDLLTHNPVGASLLAMGPYQAPTTPPSSRVMAITEERGLPFGRCSGKVEPPFSPGC